MTTEQRQRLLIETLEKDGGLGALKNWSKDTSLKARRLLQEFHHIFSLESGEMGCTNATEHVIELMPGQEEPFKERFRRIAPPLVDEVRQHIQEMLDGGAYGHPKAHGATPLCSLERRTGFCIEIFADPRPYQERRLPPSSDPRDHVVSYRCLPILMYGSQIRLLAGSDGKGVPAVHCIYGR